MTSIYVFIAKFGDIEQRQSLIERLIGVTGHCAINCAAANVAETIVLEMPLSDFPAFVNDVARSPDLNWIEYCFQFA